MTTPTPDRAVVEERLERLERALRTAKRRSRWLLAAGGLAAVGCFLAWVVGNTATTAQAHGPKVIRANQFILEDETGKTRAMLTVDKDGPRLCLDDQNGKCRATLHMAKDGPSLRLFDESDKPRVGLAISDESGKVRAGLAVTKAGSGLVLSDESGKVIWSRP